MLQNSGDWGRRKTNKFCVTCKSEITEYMKMNIIEGASKGVIEKL